MSRFGVLAFCAVSLAGCIPGGFYYRAETGQRGDATPALAKKVEIDKSICQGETAKSILNGGPRYDDVQRELATRGCMAQRGWIVRPK